MAIRNLYQRLAVPMRADPVEIWLAYRRITLTADPEMGTRPDLEQFRDAQDAYRILSDPARRRAHDIELSTGRRTLASETPRWKPPLTIPDDFLTRSPSIEELHDHIAQNFFGYSRKSDGPCRRLGFDAILQHEDARFGCRLPVIIFEGRPQILFEIPRDTHDGEVFEMDLSKLGIHNLMLQLRVVVI